MKRIVLSAAVLLCAADTFRAAAIEQLEVWGERTGTDVIRQKQGSDPSAVLFDALQSAKSRKVDYVIVDTAGRLHTKDNLMLELEKMRRTATRVIPDAPHEVLLVLDATIQVFLVLADNHQVHHRVGCGDERRVGFAGAHVGK